MANSFNTQLISMPMRYSSERLYVLRRSSGMRPGHISIDLSPLMVRRMCARYNVPNRTPLMSPHSRKRIKPTARLMPTCRRIFEVLAPILDIDVNLLASPSSSPS